jgi:hypothetical protein
MTGIVLTILIAITLVSVIVAVVKEDETATGGCLLLLLLLVICGIVVFAKAHPISFLIICLIILFIRCSFVLADYIQDCARDDDYERVCKTVINLYITSYIITNIIWYTL